MLEKLLKDYNTELSSDGIDGKRLAERFDAISKIGTVPEGGVSRKGFSPEERQAKNLVISWMKDAGLTVTEDAAGNVFGRLKGNDDTSSIASGSHLDTVPSGGNFDGVPGYWRHWKSQKHGKLHRILLKNHMKSLSFLMKKAHVSRAGIRQQSVYGVSG